MPKSRSKSRKSSRKSSVKSKLKSIVKSRVTSQSKQPEQPKIPDRLLIDEDSESKYSKCIADDCYYLPINTTLQTKSIGQSLSNPYELTSQPDTKNQDEMIKCIKKNRFYNSETNTCDKLTTDSWDKIHFADKFKYCANNYMLYNPERNSCTTAINDFKYYANKIDDLILHKSNNMEDPTIKKYIKLLLSVIVRISSIINPNTAEALEVPEIKTPEDYYKYKEFLFNSLKGLTSTLKQNYENPEIDIRKLKFYRYLLQEDSY